MVATHTDKVHIYNHIIFHSASLDCTHKFRDFLFVGLALQSCDCSDS
ncbi:MAG: relaxase/mobilization nuclease domain-containing protein [Eubacterium sp.]|nr:relaxase/mobilization nuclease domain-containing protein [Eubacterium sp.]